MAGGGASPGLLPMEPRHPCEDRVMKRLLVASDLSPRSDRAVAQAAHLAARFGARLVILHAVDDELPKSVFDAEREQAQRILDETAARLRQLPRDRIAIQVVGGLDFQAILRTAREEAADLIVLGAHRRSILEDVLTGTTVERVIRNTTTPVLVVKQADAGDYACTLAALDLVDEASGVLRLAHGLAGGQTLYAMHVLGDAIMLQMKVASVGAAEIDDYQRLTRQQCEALLHEIARRADVPPGDWLPVVEWGVAAPAILTAAQTFGARLGVVGTRTRDKGAIERLLFGSVAERLLLDMSCDVLAVPLAGATPLPGADMIATLG